MWESGLLDEKFYKGFKPTGVDSKTGLKTYDNSWMFDEKNSDQLNRSLAKFYTDVAADRDYEGQMQFETSQENLSEQELEEYKKKERAKKQIAKEFEKPSTPTKPSEKDKQLSRLENNWKSLIYPEGEDGGFVAPDSNDVISFYRNNINQSHELRYYNEQEAQERNLPRGEGYYRVISGDMPDTGEIETFYLDFITKSFDIPLLTSLYEQNN